MPLAKLLSQQLLGVSVGVVSGVNSMTEEQRAVAARGGTLVEASRDV